MIEKLQQFWNYLFTVGVATGTQLFILFGPIILLAILMNFVARQNEKLSYQVFGSRLYLYIFGWLGTSVHELGHAIFAVIFAHKVSEIKLFSPKSGKSLGHVKHNYKKGNPYQTLGNFFIGLGPVLLGSVLLLIISWLLFKLDIFQIADQHRVVLNFQLLKNLDSLQKAAVNIGSGIWFCFEQIFTGPHTNWWKIVLFVYLFYAIGSSITLSSSDIKGASHGFFYFVIVLFLFNLLTLWIGNFAADFFRTINFYLSGFYFLIIVSLCLNIVFVIVLLIARGLISVLVR
jgi:hypothetical protein